MYVIVPQTVKEALLLVAGKRITLKAPCCTINTRFPALGVSALSIIKTSLCSIEKSDQPSPDTRT